MKIHCNKEALENKCVSNYNTMEKTMQKTMLPIQKWIMVEVCIHVAHVELVSPLLNAILLACLFTDTRIWCTS